jgi:hypothetical protein
MRTRPATWKVVTVGAALTGLGIAGVGIATADPSGEPSPPAGITVDGGEADASPESADSPAESATDSPDAVAPAPSDDASPESADSPTESVTDSPDASPDTASPDDASPDDSPDQP